MERMTRWALAAAWLAAVSPATAAERSYVVDAERSLVTISVGKAGLFSFAGHAHEVVAPSLAGEVIADPAELGRSSVQLTFEAVALRVVGKGEPPEDVPKVQAKMIGPEVLEAARFPAITFQSVGVSGQAAGAGAWSLEVEGDFALHGITKRIKLPLRAEIVGDTLTVSASFQLRQSDFGIRPLSVAGVVNVKDALGITCRIVAQAR